MRAAGGMDESTVTELETVPWIPENFVFDNVYFVGGGVGSDKKLGTFFARGAIAQAQRDYIDNDEKVGTKAAEFKAMCARLKTVELWQRFLHHKFGMVAQSSAAVTKLVEHLCTKAGMEKVNVCMENDLPGHGKSDSQPGIPECRALLQELETCLSLHFICSIV